MSLSGTSPVAANHHLSAIAFEPDDGVLLIGHGTRDPIGTQQFFALGELLTSRLASIPVEACLLELQSPTIDDGWKQLHAHGVRQVVAAPLLLFAAGHAKADIPHALSRCAAWHSEMTWRITRPLSRAPELLSLVLKRLDDTLAVAAVDLNQTAIVMVGRGSYDPCATTDMKLLTHWVAGQRKAAVVTTGFYAMAQPSLPDVLQAVTAIPSIRSVIVQPHLLFEGALYQSIIAQVQLVAKQFPDKRFTVSKYLGPEPEVADAVSRRISGSRGLGGKFD